MLDTELKIILLNHRNNYVENSSMISNTEKVLTFSSHQFEYPMQLLYFDSIKLFFVYLITFSWTFCYALVRIKAAIN